MPALHGGGGRNNKRPKVGLMAEKKASLHQQHRQRNLLECQAAWGLVVSTADLSDALSLAVLWAPTVGDFPFSIYGEGSDDV